MNVAECCGDISSLPIKDPVKHVCLISNIEYNYTVGQFRGKRDKGLEQKLLTGHIVIVYFYRP